MNKNLPSSDAIKTYRYLRIGLIAAVVLLAAAVLIENRTVVSRCWQNSISAYYYTPARAIFVGTLIAVGFALIVIKGRNSFEDICLNVAGMLAPIVAIVPTTDVGRCWSVPPNPLPLNDDGSLAHWVVTNIDNNFTSLLIAGAIGLAVAALIAFFLNGVRGVVDKVGKGTIASLVFTGLLLLLGWRLMESWDGFYTGVHGPSAIMMFVFLIGAVGSRAFAHKDSWKSSAYFRYYFGLGLLMSLGGLAIWRFRIGDEHTVFTLEAFEIILFAVFWLIQTKEHWDEGPLVGS